MYTFYFWALNSLKFLDYLQWDGPRNLDLMLKSLQQPILHRCLPRVKFSKIKHVKPLKLLAMFLRGFDSFQKHTAFLQEGGHGHPLTVAPAALYV